MNAADFDQETDAIIQRYGWVVMCIPADEEEEAEFAYTVGLTAHGLAEFVIAGLRQPTMQSLLNRMAQRAMAGELFHHGQRVSGLIKGYEVVLVASEDFDRDSLWPGMALERYGSEVVLIQVVWPDQSGSFPWDADYTLPTWAQPVVTRR